MSNLAISNPNTDSTHENLGADEWGTRPRDRPATAQHRVIDHKKVW